MVTSLAVTISPPQRYEHYLVNPMKMVYLDDVLYFRQVLNYSRIKRFIFYPELDPKGRLHYHGIVNLDHNEEVRFYKHTFFKLYNVGFVDTKKLKTFKDKLKWTIYMQKEWGKTKDILSINWPFLPDHKLRDIKDNITQQRELITKKLITDYFTLLDSK